MSEKLRFDNQVVVVTGAGGGLGKAYALFYGSRGASVLVNDLGGPLNGSDGANNSRAADQVVKEIVAVGGKAVANFDSVADGEKIINSAITNFGAVHILINNAGILRDRSLKNMTESDFERVQQVHLFGSYSVTHAAWPHFRRQKFGRVINTASAAGLYGNFGQANYSAAKAGLIGFTETLAKEGVNYNITANVIVPLAASRMTETVLPPEILNKLRPELIVPVVGYLTHESVSETNGIYETAAGVVTKVRWERGDGVQFKVDSSFTPSALLKKFAEITSNFGQPEHPTGPKDLLTAFESSRLLSANEPGPEVSFKNQVVVVTGAGNGIGQQYALLFAKLGAKVVVNDIADPQKTIDKIVERGGLAVGDRNDVTNGEAIIKTAIKHFGAVHVVVNNAGIIRDKSFLKMTDDLWNAVQKVHLLGTFAVTKAAWPYFLRQKYGRVVNTTSTSGIYGNFGQTNYAAAKAAILGFTKTVALEGAKYNILANAVAPTAGTAMTVDVFPKEMHEILKPEYIAPITVLLSSSLISESGKCFEAGAGWVGRTRWQRSGGVYIPDISIEKVRDSWSRIVDFEDGRDTHPESVMESNMPIFEMINQSNDEASSGNEASSSEVEPSKLAHGVGNYRYDEKAVILYNLGVGASAKQLNYVFESDDRFQPVPTFGTIPMFHTPFDYDAVMPNFNPMMLLHGEQYLEVKKWPIPTECEVETTSKLLDLSDKGKAAVCMVEYTSVDKITRDPLFYNVMSVFVRGSGNFNGKRAFGDHGRITATNAPPPRSPDYSVQYRTTNEQAALYRLSGDLNPLHIDPEFAHAGGFKQPILHGLATFGISARLLAEKFGVFRDIKARFTGYVFPGETLQVDAWREGTKVIFETLVVERNTKAISAAAVNLLTEISRL